MKLIIPILAIATAFTLTAVRAEEGHSHGDHGHAHAAVTLPSTLPELWTALEKEKETLVKAIVSQDGHATHDAVDVLTAYAKALPELASGLDDSARKRIEGQSKNLLRVLDNLHHASEGPDWKKAEAELPKLEGILKLLSTQIPPKN